MAWEVRRLARLAPCAPWSRLKICRIEIQIWPHKDRRALEIISSLKEAPATQRGAFRRGSVALEFCDTGMASSGAFEQKDTVLLVEVFLGAAFGVVALLTQDLPLVDSRAAPEPLLPRVNGFPPRPTSQQVVEAPQSLYSYASSHRVSMTQHAAWRDQASPRCIDVNRPPSPGSDCTGDLLFFVVDQRLQSRDFADFCPRDHWAEKHSLEMHHVGEYRARKAEPIVEASCLHARLPPQPPAATRSSCPPSKQTRTSFSG
jgi:hypothetical protein